MLTAIVIVLLDAVGVAPTPEQLQEMQFHYRERRHHAFLDFGSTRGGSADGLTIGFGYVYYVDRRYNGVSFEVLGQKIGDMFDSPKAWWVGGGLGYYPTRSLKFFMQAGALFEDKHTSVQGRVGFGYRLPFFHITAMPFVYAQTTDEGDFSWSIAARLSY